MAKANADTLDDFEAVRAVVSAIEKFATADQQRILRWAQEKLGLSGSTVATIVQDGTNVQHHMEPATKHLAQPNTPGASPDIKSFILRKNPSSDTQFTAAVAYYHRFEAPPTMRKESIEAGDLQDACRMVGRNRLSYPAQTLVNTHRQGLLDKGAERGTYTLSTVGENLVAVAMPAGQGSLVTERKKRHAKAKPGAKKARR